MAKGQMRSNKEVKKPKAPKAPVAAATSMLSKGALAPIGGSKKKS